MRTADGDGWGAKPLLENFKGVLKALRWAPEGRLVSVLATADAHKEIGATAAGAALVGEISATIAQDVQRIPVVDSAGLRFASPADLFVYEYDWMPNMRGFAATAANGNGDNNWWIAKLYTVDRATQTAHELYSPKLQINAPRVSPDGKSVAFISGIMSDFGSVGGDVYVIPSSGGTPVNLTPGMHATANAISWTGRSDRITFTGLTNANAMIETVGVATKAVKALWAAPKSISADGLRVSIARDGIMRRAGVRGRIDSMELVLDGYNAPGWDRARTSKAARRITRNGLDGMLQTRTGPPPRRPAAGWLPSPIVLVAAVIAIAVVLRAWI